MISALSWNEAFTNFFKQHPIIKKNGPWIYAIIVTIITLVITAIITNQSEIIDNSLNEENENTNN